MPVVKMIVGLAAMLVGIALLLYLLRRPLLVGIAWFAGWTAWLWTKGFIINPKNPKDDLRRFLGLAELTENRIEVVQWGDGPSARVLYATWMYGPTLPYCLASLARGRTPDIARNSDFQTMMLPEGVERPDIVYDFGEGALADAAEVFRRQVRKIGLDLVLLSFLAIRVRPYAVPFSKLEWKNGVPQMTEGVTDHVRIIGDRPLLTNSMPVKNDGVEIRFIIRVFWRNNNIMALRFSTSPYEGILDEAVNAAVREWSGSRQLSEALATKASGKPEQGELEEYVREFLNTRETILLVQPDGTTKSVSVAVGFQWEITGVRVTDVLYASDGDRVKGDKILSDPAATRAQGSAAADARKSLNKADLETIGKADDAEVERVERVALARATGSVTVIRGTDMDKALLAQIANNGRPNPPNNK